MKNDILILFFFVFRDIFASQSPHFNSQSRSNSASSSTSGDGLFDSTQTQQYVHLTISQKIIGHVGRNSEHDEDYWKAKQQNQFKQLEEYRKKHGMRKQIEFIPNFTPKERML